ncbi:MAG: DM13 domain-containing protein [Woeseiaceae bacterium]
MNRAIYLLLGMVLLAGGWFFVSPLFIDRAVDERFDFVADDGQVDMRAVTTIPADKRHAKMREIMAAAAAAPDHPVAEQMPATTPEIIARGQFVDADVIHKGRGSATVYRLPDGQQVVRFEDFRSTNGPALVVYLAKHPAPSQASHVTDGGFVSLGKLKGNVGNQNYVVPPGTDLSEFHSVVIWCELFGVLFSPAALTRT